MKIVLFAATGTIGQRILREALSRGHDVIAIVRDPSRLTVTAPNLTVRVGDIMDPDSVAKAVSGANGVVSAYGSGPDKPAELLQATKSLIEGVKRAGVPRLISVGGAASLEVAPGVQLVDTPGFPAEWKDIAIAHRDALDLYRKSDLNWTNVSPAGYIEPGERTSKYRTSTDQLIIGPDGQSRICAEDFAVALIDEVEHPRFPRQRFTAAY
jgi:uncharacterized protein